MRALLLFMIVPVVWTLAWVLLRLIFVERLRAAKQRGTVVEGTWRDPESPTPVSGTGEKGPLCGRRTLHLLLRTFGAEEGCRHCAAIAAARRESERRAAVEEAERQISLRDRG